MFLFFLFSAKMLKYRSICIFLPKEGAYKRAFDETKYVFFIKDDEFLEKYNEIWEKVKNSIKK